MQKFTVFTEAPPTVGYDIAYFAFIQEYIDLTSISSFEVP
jgi:hypothetical protein